MRVVKGSRTTSTDLSPETKLLRHIGYATPGRIMLPASYAAICFTNGAVVLTSILRGKAAAATGIGKWNRFGLELLR